MSNNYFKDFVAEHQSLTPELEQEAIDIISEFNSFIESTDLSKIIAEYPYFSIEDFNSIYNFIKGVSVNSPYVKPELRSNGIVGLNSTDTRLAKSACTHLATFYGNEYNPNGVGYINSTNMSTNEKIKKELEYANMRWLQTKIGV
jgi:hypothetical protein